MCLLMVDKRCSFGADFAVSAPYQDGGTVYIYYGKASGDDGVIVNVTEQQVN